jgi:hypothetical protein
MRVIHGNDFREGVPWATTRSEKSILLRPVCAGRLRRVQKSAGRRPAEARTCPRKGNSPRRVPGLPLHLPPSAHPCRPRGASGRQSGNRAVIWHAMETTCFGCVRLPTSSNRVQARRRAERVEALSIESGQLLHFNVTGPDMGCFIAPPARLASRCAALSWKYHLAGRSASSISMR